MPDDKRERSDDSGEGEEPDESNRSLVPFKAIYSKIVNSTITKANRETATASELKSARGLFFGAIAGFLITGVLLLLAGSIMSPPIAALVIMSFSGLGWAESRYRGQRGMLPDGTRESADGYYALYTRVLRAIDDAKFPPEQARALREQAFADYQRGIRALAPPPSPTEPEPRTPESQDG